MILNVVEKPEYMEATRLNLKRAPPEVKYVINNKLAGWNCFFWGGAAREPVYHAMYDGRDWQTKDWDIIVDDSVQTDPIDLDGIFAEERRDPEKCPHNRYGTIKWKPRKGVEIDVSRFSNANMIRRGETDERSLLVALASCDFNTGSIAYGLRDGKLYDGGAMEGLRMRVVDLHYADDEPHILMARLVMHTNDMGFAIGSNGIHLIRTHYTEKAFPEIDRRIEKYLERKGEEKHQRHKEVIDRLKEIALITT